jgi:hypothetical protein
MELLSKDGVAYNVVPLKLSVWWGGKVCYLWSAYDAVHMQATSLATASGSSNFISTLMKRCIEHD